jgi:hypothetical protein
MHSTDTEEQTTENTVIPLNVKSFYEPAFYQVAAFISKHGGNLEEAKDIFHDAIIIYMTQGCASLQIRSEADYIAGIARHLWFKRVRKSSISISIDETIHDVLIPEEPTINQRKLISFLEHIGKKCLDLLLSFYMDQDNIKKIKNTFGFSTEHSASVQKYKCIEKLRSQIKTKKMTYEDFLG